MPTTTLPLSQPLAVYPPYYESFMADISLQLNQNTAAEISPEKAFRQSIQLQAQRHQEAGAEQFPVILDIIGMIQKYSGWFSIGTVSYANIIRYLDAHPKVSHIVLNIDSGGGMVNGTTALCETIRQCQTPVISFTDGYACSAAQQILSAAHLSVAAPYASLLGSIGTYISFLDFDGAYEKLGAKRYELYAPESTEKNKEFRSWKEGNSQQMQAYLSHLAQEFISVMKQYRGEKLQDDGLVFKGKTYTPTQAKEIGLVDEILTLDEVLNNL